jgi:hypothetical protein
MYMKEQSPLGVPALFLRKKPYSPLRRCKRTTDILYRNGSQEVKNIAKAAVTLGHRELFSIMYEVSQSCLIVVWLE